MGRLGRFTASRRMSSSIWLSILSHQSPRRASGSWCAVVGRLPVPLPAPWGRLCHQWAILWLINRRCLASGTRESAVVGRRQRKRHRGECARRSARLHRRAVNGDETRTTVSDARSLIGSSRTAVRRRRRRRRHSFSHSLSLLEHSARAIVPKFQDCTRSVVSVIPTLHRQSDSVLVPSWSCLAPCVPPT